MFLIAGMEALGVLQVELAREEKTKFGQVVEEVEIRDTMRRCHFPMPLQRVTRLTARMLDGAGVYAPLTTASVDNFGPDQPRGMYT